MSKCLKCLVLNLSLVSPTNWGKVSPLDYEETLSLFWVKALRKVARARDVREKAFYVACFDADT